jgi:predicted transcriptional regulator
MDYLSLLRSELKQKILLSLLKGGKKLSELKAEVETTETTILHVLKEFEKLELTSKTSGTYCLSPLGFIEAQICRELYNATEAMEKFKEFWLTHQVQPIPSSSILKIGYLKDSILVKSESSELGKVHETFMNVLVNSKKVRGTSPIFHADYVAAFKRLLDQGETVELICTEQILNKTLQSASSTGDAELFLKFIAQGLLNIYVTQDLKIALTITENVFSLGLFNLDDEYDYNMDLISSDSKALQWGEEVFQEYLKRSKKVDFQDLIKP